MTYKQQLLTPEWRAKRAKILKRDNYCCTKCSSKHRLQIHHKYYNLNKKAWEYPNKALITLCETCHEKEHNIVNGKKGLSYKDFVKAIQLEECDQFKLDVVTIAFKYTKSIDLAVQYFKKIKDDKVVIKVRYRKLYTLNTNYLNS